MPHFPLRFYADSRLAPERRNGSNPMERNLGTLTKAKRKKQKILHIGKNVISLQSDSRRVLSTNTRETSLKGNGKGKYSGCGAVG